MKKWKEKLSASYSRIEQYRLCKGQKISPNSGETLVEVLAATAIFLLMMAIMQGAISFCTNAQHKSEAIRSNNAKICENLQKSSATITPNGSATYSFKAITSDGEPGGNVLFEVEAGLGTKEVSYEDESGTEQTIIFYLFLPTANLNGGGAGGEGP